MSHEQNVTDALWARLPLKFTYMPTMLSEGNRFWTTCSMGVGNRLTINTNQGARQPLIISLIGVTINPRTIIYLVDVNPAQDRDRALVAQALLTCLPLRDVVSVRCVAHCWLSFCESWVIDGVCSITETECLNVDHTVQLSASRAEWKLLAKGLKHEKI